MEWQADATLLCVRRHGESAAIIEVLTKQQGRYAGLVRGGAGRRLRPLLQAGNRLHVCWKARLAEHLGTMTVEMTHARASEAMAKPLHLSALMAACALVQVLPERQPYPRLADLFETLLDVLDDEDIWPPLFIRFELALLDEMGFGLDLSRCAVTGENGEGGKNDALSHISPRSGRAVSPAAAAPYLDRLYPLPPFFLDSAAPVSSADIRNGFDVTGHFLVRRLFANLEKPVPEARAAMLKRLYAHLPQ